jgi:ribosome-binding factor A
VSKRIARLNEQFKRELATLVREEVRDPRVGSATITGVEVARDLGSARVFVRVGGGSEAMAETLRGLEAAAPFLRSRLGRMLHVRKIPELRFREDRSLEGARRIEQVLSEVLEIPDEDVTPEESDGVSEDAE